MADEHRPVISPAEIAPLLQGPLIWSTRAWNHSKRRDMILVGWTLNTSPTLPAPSCLHWLYISIFSSLLHLATCGSEDGGLVYLSICRLLGLPLWSRLKNLRKIFPWFFFSLWMVVRRHLWLSEDEFPIALVIIRFIFHCHQLIEDGLFWLEVLFPPIEICTDILVTYVLHVM